MGHEIFEHDNMFSVRTTPWHELGKVIKTHPTTARDAIIAAELDRQVEPRDIWVAT